MNTYQGIVVIEIIMTSKNTINLYVFRKFSLFTFILTAILFVPYSYGQTNSSKCFSTRWPQELSALAPDPSVRFGRLPNGFRYIIKQNETPSDRVALYLDVQVGSINEKETERGYAHYLEHMLFNGSTHFPPGKLIKYFQNIGMKFGADTNAYTTFENTVYIVDLPKGDKKELEKGLLVMSDYAQGALFLPEEVEKERGVILSEKLARDSVDYRTQVAINKNALKGTLLAERQPIGKEETIKSADSSGLRDFYDKWYRPDNMILIMVGDLDVSNAEALVKKSFSSFMPRSSRPQCPEIGELKDRGLDAFYHYEPQAGRTQVTIASYWNTALQNDSFDLQVEELQQYMATSILQKRLEKAAEREVGLISSPRVYSGDIVNTIRYSGISAFTSEDKWRDLLSVLESTSRQATMHGITGQELELAKKNVQAYLREQVDTQASRRSTRLGRELIYTVNNNRVFQSPEQEQQLFSSAVDSFTAEDIERALITLFGRPQKLIEVTGNTEIASTNPEQQILTAYSHSKSNSIQANQEELQPQFPYLSTSMETVPPLQKKSYKDIDVHSYVFSNNTVVRFKKTDFEKNQLSVKIQFGPGQRGEPSPGTAMLGEAIVDDSGTATLTASQLADVLAGTSVTHNFSIDNSHFSLSGSSLTGEAELLFETLYTLLRDPGVREDVYQNTLTRVEQMYQSISNTLRGSEALHIEPFLAGSNPLFGMVPLENVEKIPFSQIKKWVLSVFADAQLEISVVGDVDEKTIVQLAGKYFGTLPSGKKVSYEQESVVFPTGEKRTFSIDSDLNKTLLALAWKTEGFKDIATVRRLNLLADVFEERIRLAVREKLGASYSPVVYHTASRFIPDYGMLYVRIITDVRNDREVEEVVRSISHDLATSGVTEEELIRAKKPTLTSLKDMLRTNGYWLNTVLAGSTLYPEQLQWPTTILEDYADITADELTSLAGKYLVPGNGVAAIVVPHKGKEEN